MYLPEINLCETSNPRRPNPLVHIYMTLIIKQKSLYDDILYINSIMKYSKLSITKNNKQQTNLNAAKIWTKT